MLFDRNLLGASVAVRHLLESRLHLIAAEEAMANVEGFTTEYRDAVQLRHSLDEVFSAVEDRATELSRMAAERHGGQGPAA